MKLKTLKNLRYDKDGMGGIHYNCMGNYVCPEKLKQEVIKWIKDFEKTFGKCGSCGKDNISEIGRAHV